MNNKAPYTIWLPKEMKENLMKEAKAKGLTLSAYMIILLEKREK